MRKNILLVLLLFNSILCHGEEILYKKITKIKEVPDCYYYKNHTYIYVKKNVNWYKAMQLSKDIGGYLLVVNDFMENMNIRNILKDSTWLGFTDVKNEGKFEWINGDKVIYTDWQDNEPNNLGGKQSYALYWLNFNFNWDDQEPEAEYYYICEFDEIIPVEKLINSRIYLYESEQNEIISDLNKTIEENNLSGVTVKKEDNGININFENIQFQPDSKELMDTEKEKLKSISQILKKYKNKHIKITGHTAKIGLLKACIELSEQRAQSTAEYLIEIDVIQKENCIVEGKGYNEPVADNNTEDGRKKNRRVEILIIND